MPSSTDMQTRISLARSEAEGLAGYLTGQPAAVWEHFRKGNRGVVAR